MKNNGSGKAAMLSNLDYSKIRKNIINEKYKILFDIAWYTGERWGALVQLRKNDIYQKDGTPKDYITFRARTRKASPDGTQQTRQIPVNETLWNLLNSYSPKDGYLFPSRNYPEQHITLRNADSILRKAVAKAGLAAKGISTHSTRVTFITKLHEQGTDIYTIQQITGHKDLKALAGYINISPDRIKNAINLL
ncbi:tyrosine-type recombinase/integrase [Calothrix rhizosoleniae]|uniref:tyrosine-type recombinase/integrase n=1 Tax=Calothrix rhizosoleniae TaxID=888997 RepID=UPI000B49BA68|nr:tyrosine-type recombinase/integrase [Calothrix rhizosoleniae]